jgi:hypothetical protein
MNLKKTAEISGIIVVFALSVWLVLNDCSTALFVLLLATLGVEILLRKWK